MGTTLALLLAVAPLLAFAKVDNYSVRPGVNSKKSWSLEDMLDACNETWSTRKWLCNPDGILSKEQELRLETHLHEGPPIQEAVSSTEVCTVELRLVMVRDLDEKVLFRQHGYGNAVSFLASRLADVVMKNRHSRPFCCHTIVILMSYHQGQVYYGLASCKLFKLPYCRLRSLFALHQSALYKRDYFQHGLRGFWADFRTEFADPKPEENCNPFRPTTATPVAAAAATTAALTALLATAAALLLS